ncbi:hypothetical protein [Sphingomonas sp. PP-CE-1G-424]|uniref:hypothetical protein n=1 Tax=Sphingomonas sp. PP-CE-1G-424 TaxID=2135658 RepID=UPI001055DC4B|nr:hypothetical protein [Sphingomonas sp. PP-CE-1G-424]TCP65888.1 hypothetical protein C8J43_10892 [Sphingomonas sp. PP-CE-1G-424]
MSRPAKIERAYRLRAPHLRLVDIHRYDCDCDVCAPYVPSDPDRLTAKHIGMLACAGAFVGSAIMFAINPAAAAAALLATIGF